MIDIINRQLSRAINKNCSNTDLLQRYFRLHFRIHLSKEALQNRMSGLK